MKRTHFLIIAFLFFAVILIGRAQVGINTENPESTFEIRKIDGYESYQGLLLPRLTEDEINKMTKSNPLPPESLMVYNTTKQCVYIYKKLLGWRCVEFNKQSLAFEYIGESGTWMKGLTTTASNTVTFRVTNNLSIPISGQNLNNALTLPNVSGTAYTIIPIRDYSSETFPAGQYRDYTYKITGYTPTTSGEALTVKFSILEKEVSGNIIIKDQIGVQPIDITFNGDYITNKKFDSNNTITLKVKNFTNTSYSNVDLSNAIHLNFPGGGIEIVSGQNSSVEIPSGEKSFTYQLEGTPLAPGVINTSFVSNANVIGILNKSQVVSEPPASTLSVTTMTIKGVYVEGTNVNGTNYINVTLKNDNNFPLEHLDLSNALKFNVGSGVSVVAGQHTDVSINANGTIILKYELNGASSGSTLEATWNYGNFGTITKTEPIKTQLWVYPNYISNSANGVSNDQVTIKAGGTNGWTIKNATRPSWLAISQETGSGDTVITITSNPHTTDEVKFTEIIVERADGATGKVIVSKQASNELNVEWNGWTPYGRNSNRFSINGGTRTFTVSGDTNSTVINVFEKPDWVESVRLNQPSGTLVITTKSRTTAGPAIRGIPFSFSYGPNLSYVYTTNIEMGQKAELCPDSPPLSFKISPYFVSRYKDFIPSDKILLAEHSGVYYFKTYDVDIRGRYFNDPSVQHNGTAMSYLYLVPYYSIMPDSRHWKARLVLVYRNRIDYSPQDRQEYKNVLLGYESYLSDFIDSGLTGNIFGVTEVNNMGDEQTMMYNLSNVPTNIIKGCFCIDGYDENTPERP